MCPIWWKNFKPYNRIQYGGWIRYADMTTYVLAFRPLIVDYHWTHKKMQTYKQLIVKTYFMSCVPVCQIKKKCMSFLKMGFQVYVPSFFSIYQSVVEMTSVPVWWLHQSSINLSTNRSYLLHLIKAKQNWWLGKSLSKKFNMLAT